MSTLFGRIDEESVRTAVRLAEELGLAELELQDGDMRLRIARAAAAVSVMPGAPATAMSAAVAAPADAARASAASAAATAAGRVDVPAGTLVRAPMAGTFYRAPAPGQPVFVDVGTAVQVDSVVCIIESMKMMNRIEAERVGRVAAVLVNNGARVQVGQPLFTLSD